MRKYYPAAAIAIAAVLVAIHLPVLWKSMSGKPWDGMQEWWCARLWLDGQDPWSKEGMARINIGIIGHPPTTSFYALPLALFPMMWMGRILGVVVLVLLALELFLLFRELKVPHAAPTAALFFAGICWTPFLQYHVGLAQVSELIGFCLFLAWYLTRRDRQWLAGVALGYACSLKLFPGLIVLFMLLSRRWRAVLAAGAAWLVIAGIMTARFGVQCWSEYFASEKLVVDMWIGHASNASLQGIVLRLMNPVCRGEFGRDPLATKIAIAGSLALIVWSWWLSRRALVKYFDLPYALFVVVAMFSNAFYWEHYHAILVLPLAVGAAALWRAWREGLARSWAIACAVVLAAGAVATWMPPNRARILLHGYRTPWGHFTAHLNEIATSLPMPLMMIALAGLLIWFARRDFRGLERLSFED